MSGGRLRVACIGEAGPVERVITVTDLVVAGWTGRDRAAVDHHIAELERLGVKRPSTAPVFYRIAAAQLTTDAAIDVLGDHTSGEVEVVVVALEDGLWVGVGSDHTDRKAEAQGVALSKQLCPKPIGPQLWRMAEVAAHWDSLTLACDVAEGGRRRRYQEGSIAALLRPLDLIGRLEPGSFRPGTAMFCGTLPTIGEIAPAGAYELTLADPVLDRTLHHRYRVRALPVRS